MDNSADVPRPEQKDASKTFPVGIVAFIIFYVPATALLFIMPFIDLTSLEKQLFPYAGWVVISSSLFPAFGIVYCFKRDRKMLYGIGVMLLEQAVGGIIDALKLAHEGHVIPRGIVSPWRLIWTIVIPAIWVAVIIQQLKSEHFMPAAVEGKLKRMILADKWTFITDILIVLFSIGGGLASIYYAERSLEAMLHTPMRSFTEVGQKMPDFTVTTLDGTEMNIEKLRGKVLLVNFWATWCDSCREEMPHLDEMLNEFDSSRFVILAVAHEETEQEIRPFSEENGFGFSMASDRDGKIYKMLAEGGIPRNYVVGADGTIRYQSIGYEEKEFEEMKKVIEQELEQTNKPKK